VGRGEVWGPAKGSRVSHEPQQWGNGSVLQRSKISKQFAVFPQNSSKNVRATRPFVLGLFSPLNVALFLQSQRSFTAGKALGIFRDLHVK